MEHLYDYLTRHVAERPEAPFLVSAETGATLTYAQSFAATHAMRAAFGMTAPVPRRILLCLPNGTTNAIIWLAALTGGHTLFPLAPDTPAAERTRLARRHVPDILIVVRASDACDFACPSARILTLADCEQMIVEAQSRAAASAVAPDQSPSVGDAAEGGVYLTTSGSTGEPKGIVLGARQIAWSARQICASHQLTPADRGLGVLPFFHVNAPVVSLCASLVAGGSVVIAERFSRTHFWDWVERHRITWASIVPTILAMLLQTERPAFLPGSLRFVRTASAPLPVVHLRAFERRFGVPVVETYGLSEAAATVAANPVPPGLRKPGSVGVPSGVAMRICRTRPVRVYEGRAGREGALEDVRLGEVGEVCIAGPSVIPGYAGGSETMAFVDGWFRTGDLGYFDADGYLYLTGRLRDVIIRGGENVAPREVEEILLAAPEVGDVAVVGVPDPIYGQRVVAYVVPVRSWTPSRERALRAYCVANLSAHKVPDAFIPVDSLPRTRSGKIQRHLLGELAAHPPAEEVAG